MQRKLRKRKPLLDWNKKTSVYDYVKPVDLSGIQITAMKEEIRNEAAKAAARDFQNFEEARAIRAAFFSYCEKHEQGTYSLDELTGLYQQALTMLNELKYEESFS